MAIKRASREMTRRILCKRDYTGCLSRYLSRVKKSKSKRKSKIFSLVSVPEKIEFENLSSILEVG